MASPRIEAVKLLTNIEKDSSYSALSLSAMLKKTDFADVRDVNFLSALIYGVLEHKITLDYNISLYLNSSLSKLKPTVLNILRVGAYQLLYMNKIPISAAVNEAVKISKKLNASYASGLINAVLRKISLNGLQLPEKGCVSFIMSVEFSVDESIVTALIRDYGIEKTREFLSIYNGRRPIFIRRNSLKCNDEELVKSLSEDGVSVLETDLDGCLAVCHTGDIAELNAYKNGLFHVQDKSSQLCCKILGVNKNDFVLDCCAAPGGKSFTIAQYLNRTGKILSCDIFEHKTNLISVGAGRLGIENITVECIDARKLGNKYSGFDKVLCDVPCSGFGVIGRKPEIRYKSDEEIKGLPEIQREILYSCAATVKEGGSLVYSTCTLNKNENDLICDRFLKDFPEFSVSDDAFYRSLTDKYITVFPDKNGGDGFFIAKFYKGKN